MASMSRRRWPTKLTPRSFRSSTVRLGNTLSSISFARNAGSYCCSPRPWSHAAMSTALLPAAVAAARAIVPRIVGAREHSARLVAARSRAASCTDRRTDRPSGGRARRRAGTLTRSSRNVGCGSPRRLSRHARKENPGGGKAGVFKLDDRHGGISIAQAASNSIDQRSSRLIIQRGGTGCRCGTGRRTSAAGLSCR
jgi:hypothetical protein